MLLLFSCSTRRWGRPGRRAGTLVSFEYPSDSWCTQAGSAGSPSCWAKAAKLSYTHVQGSRGGVAGGVWQGQPRGASSQQQRAHKCGTCQGALQQRREGLGIAESKGLKVQPARALVSPSGPLSPRSIH